MDPYLYLDLDAKLPIVKVNSLECQQQQKNPETNNHDESSNLPKPSFREIPYQPYRKRKTHPPRNSSYYKYRPPTSEELLSIVEYDMDEMDSEWLKKLNNKLERSYNYRLSESDFERVMDRLEKLSYFDKSSYRAQEVDEDAVCAICNDGDVSNANGILFCDMCDLAVHQECYGVPYIPEGTWFCRRCLQSPSCNVECVLCPNLGGAFKQTDDNRWAHVICALWIPEVCFANTVFLEPIDSIDQIPSARWKLTCYICKQKRRGACIQCHKANCYAPFHVTCAQQAGLYMKIKTHKYENPNGGFFIDVKKVAYCHHHQPKDTTKIKAGMYSGDESEEDEDSLVSKKREQATREKLKKTRKILAEKRMSASNPISEPKIDKEELVAVGRLIKCPVRRVADFEPVRQAYTTHIFEYWIEKRSQRKGVPLLRRLQQYGSYNSSSNKEIRSGNLDVDRYKNLRYDFEKARLLCGEVKKRELFKKRLIQLSEQIVKLKYSTLDREKPAED